MTISRLTNIYIECARVKSINSILFINLFVTFMENRREQRMPSVECIYLGLTLLWIYVDVTRGNILIAVIWYGMECRCLCINV